MAANASAPSNQSGPITQAPEEQESDALAQAADRAASSTHKDRATHAWARPDSGARVVAAFNGQGNDYMTELRALHSRGSPSVVRFLAAGAAAIKAEAQSPEYNGWYDKRHGMDVLSWISGEGDTAGVLPPRAYLFAAPVSYPLILLTQLAAYLETLDRLGTTHDEALRTGWLSATTGHSQGIMAAIVVAQATSANDFADTASPYLRLAVAIGCRAQAVLAFETAGAAKDSDHSPMLAVRGMERQRLQTTLIATQRHIRAVLELQPQYAAAPELVAQKTEMYISLRNGHADFVVSGNIKALVALQAAIQKASAAPDDAQARVPFSKRKPSTQTVFLSVTAPFHSAMMSQAALALAQGDARRIGVSADKAALVLPVFSTKDGADLRSGPAGLADELVALQMVEQNDFVQTLGPITAAGSYTHVVCFGPGRALSRMAHDLVVGTGLQVVEAAAAARTDGLDDISGAKPAPKVSHRVLGLERLLAAPQCVPRGVSWSEELSPRIVVRASDGKQFVDTKYTRVLGKPPVLMSGMTPTTSYLGVDLVAACNNAGFQGELAAGGLAIPAHFRAKVEELFAKSVPGVGININMLYLNAHQWSFQFPLVLEFAKAGYPIESITIGAGVPTPGKAEEIFSGLKEAGVKVIGFKPGSIQAIRDVLELARLHPDMNIMLQWTSGRGGGHHSFEDFHVPLLETYASIREHENVLLVVGSGFGDAAGSFPYLDGSWATKAPFARAAPMPVDGVLFGSRCMVAKEAATSPAVKKMIVDAPGVSDEKEWDISYDQDAGGVITVQSELGEPIHKIHTRGMRLWKKYDTKYFSLPRGPQREAAIAADKQTIIQELNADFQKVYFGRRTDGAPADLEDMTYADVLNRMVELMFVRGGGDPAGRLAPDRWIDTTYQTRTFKMMQRTERRFLAREGAASFVADAARLDSPAPERFVAEFVAKYPACAETLLADEDVEFFVDLCKDLRNGKPVNFIPIIDADLHFWLKKDSLWFSEQLDAVPGRDPGRVCVLHGPVAARFSTKVDEPISEILGGIHQGYLDLIAGRAAQGAQLAPVNLLCPAALAVAPWAEVAAATPRVVRNKRWVPNPIALLCARPGTATRRPSEDEVELVAPDGDIVAKVRRVGSARIELDVIDTEVPGAVLKHTFFYRPDTPTMPLHQGDDYDEEIKRLYRTVWDCKEHVTLQDTFTDSTTLTEEDIVLFNAAIGNVDPATAEPSREGSIDIATMAGWRPLIRALFADDLQGNLLKLVHLAHGYRLVPPPSERRPVRAGETLDSRAVVRSVQIEPGVGKKVRVEGALWRYTTSGERYEWLALHSEFLIRGAFSDWERTFSTHSYEATVICSDPVKAAVLASKPWIELSKRVDVGDTLHFRLALVKERGAGPAAISDVKVEGVVLRQGRSSVQAFPLSPSGPAHSDDSDSDGFVELQRGGRAGLEQVGRVSFQTRPGEAVPANPVTEFLEREREPANVGTMFESGGHQLLPEPITVTAPRESLSYARASRDLNSIHRSGALATLAELPEGKTIVHGMWTAAMGRGVLERAAGGAAEDPSRIASYEVDFVGMVFPGDPLAVTLQHVGVVGGRKLVHVRVNKLDASRQLVMVARAELEQPKTAYLFTGQGSAEVGMGMDRYGELDLVRKVWDTADKHLKAMYGFSILRIVRENPKSLTVHFGGPQGKRIRDNYRRIRTEDPDTGKMVPLIREIRANTKSFTFHSPQGLLFATQFSQPALVLVQKAAFEELVEGGFVPDDAVFAGHSLGEYAALASFADVLSIEALVETVFLRGMVMQNAVPRDAAGRSNYGMVAANPSRIGARFTPEDLERAVDLVSAAADGALLQIVNFNVRGFQYVVAGELVALDALSETLKLVAAAGPGGPLLSEAVAKNGVELALANKEACGRAGVPFALRRGVATIPLPGIDVPFHSRKLLSGVPAFRQLLEPRLDLGNIANVTGRLVGKYIPNVVAEPFSLSRGFVERVFAATGSPALGRLLEAGEFESASSAEKARTLVVELLAHQFAMPVRWIETQDVIFYSRAQRVIEMGPAATLATMAKRSLQTKVYGDNDEYDPSVLWWKQDEDSVFYNLEDAGPDFDTFADSVLESSPELDAEALGLQDEAVSNEATSQPPPVARAAPVPVPPMPRAGPAAPDAPVSAKHVLRVLLSSKFRKPLAELDDSSTIKALSQGKSAVQNEVVGDLASEFGSGPEGGAELPLGELASKFAGYNALGKVTNKAIAKMLGSALPGGFSASAARQFLAGDCGLGPGRVDSVLVHALTLQPDKRLAGVAEAKRWLEEVRDAYASDAGVSLAPQGSAGQDGGMPSASSMMMMMMGGGGGAPPVPIPDAPVAAKHALRVLLSLKFAKSMGELDDATTIKNLSQGKSAIQNEVVGDLAAEFGSGPEGGAEMPLAELATKFPGYGALGKVTSKAIAKMLGSKLPGGFSSSAAKQYLAEERLLGPGRVDSVLLECLAMQPENRLASPADAQAWLDKACDVYGAREGLTIPSRSSGGGSGTMMMPMPLASASPLSSEMAAKLLRMIETQVEAFGEFLGRDPAALQRAVEQEEILRTKAEAYVGRLQAELGEPFCEGIHPQHDPAKVRSYDSYWNWVIQDALDMHCHVLEAVSRANGGGGIGPGAGQTAPIPDHYAAMAAWITAPKDSIEASQPPQAWFRNYLCNRATPELLEAVRHFSRNMHAMGQHEYAQVITLLAEQVKTWVDRVPVHVALFEPQAPRVRIDASDGSIQYYEEPRPGVPDATAYVEEMSRGLYYFRGSRNEVAHPSQSVELSADAAFATDEMDLADSLDPEAAEAFFASGPLPPGSSEADAGRKPRSEAELMEQLSLQQQQQQGGADLDLPTGPRLDVMRKTIEPASVKGDKAANASSSGDSARVDRQREDVYDAPAPEDYQSIHVTKKVPYIHLKSPSAVDKTVRIINEQLSSKYLSALHDISVNGVSFAGQVALVTGAGRGSIGEELVKSLLEGGATVVCTIRIGRGEKQMAAEYTRFRSIYEEFGAKGSRLILEPTNCASRQDVDALVEHVYGGLNLDIDFVIPFAAAPEGGKDISGIDSRAEMVHRMMMTNVVRLLGAIKREKQDRGVETRPAMVLLPCSPNHGEFGQDALYSEAKLGLEALVNKWKSEGWGDYLCLAAAVIGWTRSALMVQNNIVAPGIEQLGCRTFSCTETMFNLVGLLHPRMVTLAAEEPLWADLTGNWVSVPDLNLASQGIRARLQQSSKLAKSTLSASAEAAPGAQRGPAVVTPLADPRKLCPTFPELPERRPSASASLQGMVDLRKVVVVVGYGEVGPWGSAKTRWEMEAFGEFSLEGAIELAWLVGLIKPHNAPLPSNPRSRYIGWVDAATGEPVADHDVKKRYEPTLLKHCGIRLVEPSLFEGYDPAKKGMLHRVAIDRDMPPIEVSSLEEARQYRAELGDAFVDVFQAEGGEQWMIRVKKGAVVAIPKAMRFDRNAAGQIPTGWDAKRLGIPPEIADSVDPVTLFALASAVEALISSGLTDPYQLYEYVHVSEVGNTMGGGMGGMRSLKRMFHDRKMGEDIPSDTLAESFINTMPAWINMLLLSSSGPIKTPVNACATAAMSVDVGVETILAGKARVVMAGGYDDFGETGSYEFAALKATCDTDLDARKGRAVHESSRPMTESRAGFVEAQGAGAHILMDAELALEMGCPIYTVIALTATATDKQGRSIPAPGKGILTTARESRGPGEPPASLMLDLEFRRDNLRAEMVAIDAWAAAQRSSTARQAEALHRPAPAEADEHLRSRLPLIEKMAERKRAAALEAWGQGFYVGDPSIAPLRGALAVWGLGVDDIGVASMHGTSTKLNDKNESHVIQAQLTHLGRTRGNVLPVVAQKYLTGHPKGAAAAWMLNGLIQVMQTSTIPGNRNLDNVSPELRENDFLLYPNRTIRVPHIKAAYLKSFGFGSSNSEILLVHSDMVLASLSDAQFAAYRSKCKAREARTFRYMQHVYSGKHTMFQAKNEPPYSLDQEERVYLDPRARATYVPEKGTWRFVDEAARSVPAHLRAELAAPATAPKPLAPANQAAPRDQARLTVPVKTRLEVTVREGAHGLRPQGGAPNKGVGVDVEEVATFADLDAKADFIERNFTQRERDYCFSSSSPASSFAGRWSAKEAVVKAISNSSTGARPLWEGAAGSLKEVEIVASASGAPQVVLHGHAQKVFQALSLSAVKVSISHSGSVAVAQALAE